MVSGSLISLSSSRQLLLTVMPVELVGMQAGESIAKQNVAKPLHTSCVLILPTYNIVCMQVLASIELVSRGRYRRHPVSLER